MKYPKRSQYKYTKSPYLGLLQLAGIRSCKPTVAVVDLTIWLSEDAIKTWRAPPSGRGPGRVQRVYANIAIEIGADDPHGLSSAAPSD